MAVDIIGRGTPNGIRVASSHEFATDAERDAYFTANPGELVDRIYIRVGEEMQQYQDGVWQTVTPVIKGNPGLDGAPATINGYNTLEILAGDNIELEQEENKLYINSIIGAITMPDYSKGLPVTALPYTAPDNILLIGTVYANAGPYSLKLNDISAFNGNGISNVSLYLAKGDVLTSTIPLDLVDLMAVPLVAAEGSAGSGVFTNLTPTSNTVGGIQAGSTFDKVPLPEMWEKLLYPIKNPTLTNPSSTLTLTTDRFVEVGIPTDIRVTSRFNRGSISPAYGTSGFRSGLPTQYIYTGGGLGNYSNNSLTDNQVISNYIFGTPGDLRITSKVSYAGGEQPKNSDGINFGTPLAAGSTGNSVVTVSGVYPIFATTESISVMTRQPLTNAKMLEYTVQAETPTEKQSFEWESSYGELEGVKQYNLLSQQFEYLGLTAAASVAYFDVETITVTLASGDHTYKKYTYNGNQVGKRQLQIFIK